eukprot:TRINITY_DN7155_c0_g1_i6.p1 TRINITY_DN7155_c0_g1~~TRINITY_DN7155_c0_g1_i6.p1  ORF type:complete len:3046 (-),score=387.48 TRINITY_DN7155_c0_g1_i6:69-9206(-)
MPGVSQEPILVRNHSQPPGASDSRFQPPLVIESAASIPFQSIDTDAAPQLMSGITPEPVEPNSASSLSAAPLSNASMPLHVAARNPETEEALPGQSAVDNTQLQNSSTSAFDSMTNGSSPSLAGMEGTMLEPSGMETPPQQQNASSGSISVASDYASSPAQGQPHDVGMVGESLGPSTAGMSPKLQDVNSSGSVSSSGGLSSEKVLDEAPPGFPAVQAPVQPNLDAPARAQKSIHSGDGPTADVTLPAKAPGWQTGTDGAPLGQPTAETASTAENASSPGGLPSHASSSADVQDIASYRGEPSFDASLPDAPQHMVAPSTDLPPQDQRLDTPPNRAWPGIRPGASDDSQSPWTSRIDMPSQPVATESQGAFVPSTGDGPGSSTDELHTKLPLGGEPATSVPSTDSVYMQAPASSNQSSPAPSARMFPKQPSETQNVTAGQPLGPSRGQTIEDASTPGPSAGALSSGQVQMGGDATSPGPADDVLPGQTEASGRISEPDSLDAQFSGQPQMNDKLTLSGPATEQQTVEDPITPGPSPGVFPGSTHIGGNPSPIAPTNEELPVQPQPIRDPTLLVPSGDKPAEGTLTNAPGRSSQESAAQPNQGSSSDDVRFVHDASSDSLTNSGPSAGIAPAKPHAMTEDASAGSLPNSGPSPGGSLAQPHVTADDTSTDSSPNSGTSAGKSQAQPHAIADDASAGSLSNSGLSPGGSLARTHAIADDALAGSSPNFGPSPGISPADPRAIADDASAGSLPDSEASPWESVAQPHGMADDTSTGSLPNSGPSAGKSPTQPHVIANDASAGSLPNSGPSSGESLAQPHATADNEFAGSLPNSGPLPGTIADDASADSLPTFGPSPRESLSQPQPTADSSMYGPSMQDVPAFPTASGSPISAGPSTQGLPAHSQATDDAHAKDASALSGPAAMESSQQTTEGPLFGKSPGQRQASGTPSSPELSKSFAPSLEPSPGTLGGKSNQESPIQPHAIDTISSPEASVAQLPAQPLENPASTLNGPATEQVSQQTIEDPATPGPGRRRTQASGIPSLSGAPDLESFAAPFRPSPGRLSGSEAFLSDDSPSPLRTQERNPLLSEDEPLPKLSPTPVVPQPEEMEGVALEDNLSSQPNVESDSLTRPSAPQIQAGSMNGDTTVPLGGSPNQEFPVESRATDEVSSPQGSDAEFPGQPRTHHTLTPTHPASEQASQQIVEDQVIPDPEAGKSPEQNQAGGTPSRPGSPESEQFATSSGPDPGTLSGKEGFLFKDSPSPLKPQDRNPELSEDEPLPGAHLGPTFTHPEDTEGLRPIENSSPQAVVSSEVPSQTAAARQQDNNPTGGTSMSLSEPLAPQTELVSSSKENLTCDNFTGVYCDSNECGESLGPTDCVGGKCVCKPDFCSEQGTCVPANQSEVLEDAEVSEVPFGSPPKMEVLAGNTLCTPEGRPRKQGVPVCGSHDCYPMFDLPCVASWTVERIRRYPMPMSQTDKIHLQISWLLGVIFLAVAWQIFNFVIGFAATFKSRSLRNRESEGCFTNFAAGVNELLGGNMNPPERPGTWATLVVDLIIILIPLSNIVIFGIATEELGSVTIETLPDIHDDSGSNTLMSSLGARAVWIHDVHMIASCIMLLFLEVLRSIQKWYNHGRAIIITPYSALDILAVSASLSDLPFCRKVHWNWLWFSSARTLDILDRWRIGTKIHWSLMSKAKDERAIFIALISFGSVLWVLCGALYYAANFSNAASRWDAVDADDGRGWQRFESIPSSMFFVMLNLVKKNPLALVFDDSSERCFVGLVNVFVVPVFSLCAGVIGQTMSKMLLDVTKENNDAEQEEFEEEGEEEDEIDQDSEAEGYGEVEEEQSWFQTLTWEENYYPAIIISVSFLSIFCYGLSTCGPTQIMFIPLNITPRLWALIDGAVSCLMAYDWWSRTWVQKADEANDDIDQDQGPTNKRVSRRSSQQTRSASRMTNTSEAAVAVETGREYGERSSLLRYLFASFVDTFSCVPGFIHLIIFFYFGWDEGHPKLKVLCALSVVRCLKANRFIGKPFQLGIDVIVNHLERLNSTFVICIYIWFSCGLLFHMTEYMNPDKGIRENYGSLARSIWAASIGLNGDWVWCDYTWRGKALGTFVALFLVSIMVVPMNIFTAHYLTRLQGDFYAQEGHRLRSELKDLWQLKLRPTADAPKWKSDLYTCFFAHFESMRTELQKETTLDAGQLRKAANTGLPFKFRVVRAMSVLVSLFSTGLVILETSEVLTDHMSRGPICEYAQEIFVFLDMFCLVFFMVEWILRALVMGVWHPFSAVGSCMTLSTLATAACIHTEYRDKFLHFNIGDPPYMGSIVPLRLLRLFAVDSYFGVTRATKKVVQVTVRPLAVSFYVLMCVWLIHATALHIFEQKDSYKALGGAQVLPSQAARGMLSLLPEELQLSGGLTVSDGGETWEKRRGSGQGAATGRSDEHYRFSQRLSFIGVEPNLYFGLQVLGERSLPGAENGGYMWQVDNSNTSNLKVWVGDQLKAQVTDLGRCNPMITQVLGTPSCAPLAVIYHERRDSISFLHNDRTVHEERNISSRFQDDAPQFVVSAAFVSENAKAENVEWSGGVNPPRDKRRELQEARKQMRRQSERYQDMFSSMQYSLVHLYGDFPVTVYSLPAKIVLIIGVFFGTCTIAAFTALFSSSFVNYLAAECEDQVQLLTKQRILRMADVVSKIQRRWRRRQAQRKAILDAGGSLPEREPYVDPHPWRTWARKAVRQQNGFGLYGMRICQAVLFFNITINFVRSIPEITQGFARMGSALEYMEVLCECIFLAELVVNVLAGASGQGRIWYVFRTVDVITLAPFGWELTMLFTTGRIHKGRRGDPPELAEILCDAIVMTRVLRILALPSLKSKVQTVVLGFWCSRELLEVPLFLSLSIWTCFSSLFVWLERAYDGPSAPLFSSIPTAMYWTSSFLIGEWSLIDFAQGSTSRLCIVISLFTTMMFALPMGILMEGIQTAMTIDLVQNAELQELHEIGLEQEAKEANPSKRKSRLAEDPTTDKSESKAATLLRERLKRNSKLQRAAMTALAATRMGGSKAG